ncbi:hypothetical protein [Saccharomonospora piscinae]|uniref:hypothetical protein n=1 Tax=Saccharomonospora piscinae TaxID=687388 RepID=UPI000466A971|nr:hypothetical protein [Saccharomonospora piscinae]
MAGYNPNRNPNGTFAKGPVTAVLGASVLATVVAGPVGAGVSASGSGAISAQSSVGQLARATVKKAKRSAQQGQRRTAWKRLDLKETARKPRRGGRCVTNAYGGVRRFFAHTPCRSLDRVLYALDGSGGDRVVVSVSWVRMRTTAAARELRGLVDVHGTGNITPLPGTLVGADRIDWTGWNYDSARSGTLVTIAEVEPLSGNPSAAYMDDVADVAAAFPRLR